MGLFSNIFGNSGPKEGSPMTEYHPGDVFYDHENGEYNLYKVIRRGETEIVFTRGFWSSTTKPTAANWKTFELRNACEALGHTGFERPTFVTNEPVTAEDEEGYQEMLRITEGHQKRAEDFVQLMHQADALMEEDRYGEALHLYTEAASFSKFFFQIFDKRGACYLKLNCFSEAVADLEHSLSIFKDGKESLYNCAKAYYQLGNYPKAIEKLEQLVTLDEHFEDAKAFLLMVRTK
jgi:tetratricopeptide (TPR) repeat protein